MMNTDRLTQLGLLRFHPQSPLSMCSLNKGFQTCEQELSLFAIDSMFFRTSLRALFVLLPIFGFTWLFGIFGYSSDAVAAMYVFVIMNSSQGLLIFIFHCALNQEVRLVIRVVLKLKSRCEPPFFGGQRFHSASICPFL